MSLQGKKILLGVCGSIAAYKTPILVRLMIKSGAEVRVITTPSALDFVSELSLSTVSKHAVLHSLQDGAQWNNHVELGRWADIMLIAPTSCNTLAKMAMGLCDNLLMSVYLSATCPVAIAPAMDQDMYLHSTTQRNLATLAETTGHSVLPVDEGELASGLVGQGRMMEPEDIVKWLDSYFDQKKKLNHKKVLITAGPTYEHIDPVRFIGNHSSGKMGIALAQNAARMGADVTLVLGPSALRPDPQYGIELRPVTTAKEMLAASLENQEADIIICSAAVSDYTPVEVADQKIKKSDSEDLQIRLSKNPDILKTLGQNKKDNQYVVGFALETQNEIANARKKLKSKNADMIVLNSLQDEGAGFGVDTNKVTLVSHTGEKALPLMSKDKVAQAILEAIPI